MARLEHEAEPEFEEQAQGEGDLPEVGDYQEPAGEAAAEYAEEAAPAEELPEAAEAPAEEYAEGEYAAEAEAPAEAEVPAEEYPAAEVPAEEVPAEEVPVEEVPAEEVAAEEVPAEEVPAEEIAAEVPAEEAPAEAAAAEPVAPAPAKAKATAPARGAPPADKRRPRPEVISEAKTAVPAAAKDAAAKVGAKKAEKVIAGIDLGTTYSAIAYLDEHGKATIVPNSDNERITPSVVLFEEFEIIVGRIAKNNAISMPDRVIEFIKREVGDPDWVKVIDGKEYTPEVISAIILKRIVQDAEAQLGKKIEDVVVTCPAYFNDPERKATQDAGRIAGLNVLSLLNEPTAAAIAYGIEALGTDQTVMVYDLGGGTFDVTVLRISGQQIEVVATDGERYLGGKDWDDALINYVAEKFVAEHGVDPREDLEALQDLRNRSEDCKITLSKKTSANLLCHCQGKTLRLKLTREEFQDLTRPLLEQTETYVQTVLEKAQLQWKDIDRVLLTGGMTRMPAVVEMLKRVTGKEPSAELNPDEAVALGAAYFAAVLVVQGEVQVTDEAAIQKSLETIPEEIIGMLEGTVVQNVNSHSLGIIILKDGKRKNHIMIPQQTAIPVEKSGPFVTAYDNQTSVTIRVVEGESDDPEDCIQIGECVISDLPAGRPKGSIVEVTYRYNADGRIEVHGRDRQSGKEAMVEIVREAGLTQQQIEAERKEVAQVAVA